jgi:hypothetical protein
MKHSFSIHPEIRNKPVRWQASFSSGWQQGGGELEVLRDHVSRGGAFIPAAMSSSHRSGSAFKSASMVVVDIDDVLSIEQFRGHPLAEHAAWVYTSARHDEGFRLWNYDTGERLGVWLDRDSAERALEVHRSEQPDTDFKLLDNDRYRIIFQLPEVLTDADTYQCLIKHLTRELGGDPSTTNPCNIFYGNDVALHPLWQPQTVLPYSYIESAKRQHAIEQAQRRDASEDCDDTSIERAIYVLEHILDPTRDGERNQFVRITAAAACGGDALFPAWSDWASRGHHGSGRNSWQATEKFFRGFKGTSLDALFAITRDQDPDWRQRLPSEIRYSTATATPSETRAAGYDHDDFMGSMQHYMEDDTPVAAGTVSMFAAGATAVLAAGGGELSSPAPDGANPGGDSGAAGGDGTTPPAKKAKPGQDDYIGAIKDRLLGLYPGLRLNLLNQRIEQGARSEPKIIRSLDKAYIRISRGQKDVYPKNIVLDTAQVIAWENRYNPVQEYLEHCRKNVEPVSYLDTLASEVLGLSDEPTLNPVLNNGKRLHDVTLKRFLVGAVDRAFNPGCVHDWMLILVGEPNVGKSMFFQYLTPPDPNTPGHYPWTSTIQQGIAYLKEKPHALHAGWIVLLDECERYFKRRYVEELKNMISVSVDRSRRLYENEDDFPRSFVLAGNANTMDFLSDPTGNRKFLPIYVTGRVPSPQNPNCLTIDLDRLKRDRDAIWSAAYQAFLDEPVHNFSSSEIKEIESYSQEFTQDSAIEYKVQSLLEYRNSGVYMGNPYILLADLTDWLGVSIESHGRVHQPISDALKKFGYQPRRIRLGIRQIRAWVKVSA